MEMPVFKAISENALPAMAAMFMMLLYNLADTLFIGQTHDPYQVAAISLCTPIFMLCVSFGTVFGIGGTSLISRMLGERNAQKAKNVCSFCFWGGIASGLVLTIIILLFSNSLLHMMGVSDLSFAYAKNYLMIVSFCCPFSVIANSYNTILRSEGKPREAMGGQLLGNLINLVLDPIFISFFNMGIVGAAIATVIGNVFGALFYIRFFAAGESSLSIRLKDFAMNDGIASGVLSIGIPAALGSLLMSASQIVANKQLIGYGDLAVAGYGVAGKLCMITGTFCIGLGQGVQPLLGYCVGSKNKNRFKSFITSSLVAALGLGIGMTAIVLIFRKQIVFAFLQNPQAFDYAVNFTTIMLSTGFLFGIFYVLVSILQAMGKGLASLIVNISRQGLVFIPALFVLKAIIGINGIVWAQPVADVISIMIAGVICLTSVRGFLQKKN